MKLIYLGTSGACPTLKRSLSSTVLVLDREMIMIDCGEGTQYQFLKAGLKWNKPLKIFLTHLHSDHVMGIFGLLQTMDLQGRTAPVRIYGVKGTKSFIESVNRVVNFKFGFGTAITEIDPVKDNMMCVGGDGYQVYWHMSKHQVPSLAYLFIEDERPGTLDVEKARSLGIPDGPLMGLLKKGKTIFINGHHVESTQVVSPPRAGRKIGFSGDTRPTAELAEFFKGCDYLTFESTFQSDESDHAEKTKHSTAGEAGRLAKSAKVKTLLLNHFSARHPTTEGFYAEASAEHDNVICVKDLMGVEING